MEGRTNGRNDQGGDKGTLIIDRIVVVGYAAGMPRIARVAGGGMVQHVLNRGNGRMKLFHKPQDYQAFGSD